MEHIKDILSYNRETGIFTWIQPTYRRGKPGDIAGCINSSGYWRIPYMGRYYMAHRLAWFFEYGEWPEGPLDHINRDRLDNRISNLRKATTADNVRNAKNKGARTGVKGVVKNGNRFYGRVHFNYKSCNAGSYGTLEEAESAVKKLREKLHKEFYCHD